MKTLPKLIISIVGCELVGILGSLSTISAIPSWYATLSKPSFAPPNWVFGPAWTTLYFLMGVAFYLIWKQDTKKSAGRSASGGKKKVKTALQYFFVQLGLNFIWSPLFFGLKSPELGLLVIIALWISIVITMKKFHPLSHGAFYLLVPYLLWVTFATTLNAAIVVLN